MARSRSCGFSPDPCAICQRRTNYASRYVVRTFVDDRKPVTLFLNFCKEHAETPLPVSVATRHLPEGEYVGYTLTEAA